MRKSVKRGEIMLIAAFVVDCAQQLIYLLRTLMAQKRIPEVEVFLDSPTVVSRCRPGPNESITTRPSVNSVSIRWARYALKELGHLNKKEQQRAFDAIGKLSDHPLKGGGLSDKWQGLRRLRVRVCCIISAFDGGPTPNLGRSRWPPTRGLSLTRR